MMDRVDALLTALAVVKECDNSLTTVDHVTELADWLLEEEG